METGLRKDHEGNVIPRLIINKFVCRYNGVDVFIVDMHEAVAANPYFEFCLRADRERLARVRLARGRRPGLLVGAPARCDLMTASRSIVCAIAVSLVILGACRGMAADNERAAQLAAMCTSCHRLDGRDKGIPSIVEIDKEQFANTMAAFKRQDAIEFDHARGSFTAQ